MELTIDSILVVLKKDGINSKGQVINALEHASASDLHGLKRSVTEMIIEKEKKHAHKKN